MQKSKLLADTDSGSAVDADQPKTRVLVDASQVIQIQGAGTSWTSNVHYYLNQEKKNVMYIPRFLIFISVRLC